MAYHQLPGNGMKVAVPPMMTSEQQAIFNKKVDWLSKNNGNDYPQALKEEMYEAGIWKPTNGKAAWGMISFRILSLL